MAAENIDNTPNGDGLFNTKIPGLSDAADIQAALRLYHYGSYTYDGANTVPGNLQNPSIAKHLQNLVDADAAEVVNRNSAISTHNADTTNVHGIENTEDLATVQYVDTEITDAINGAVGGYPDLAGTALEWNTIDERFDVEPRLANAGTIITKTESFTLSAEDVGKTAILYSSSPITVTLPANASVEIPVGYSIDIVQTGTGSVTVSEGTVDVSINSKSSIKSLDGQYSKGTLVKIDTNTWFFFGNLLNTVVPTPVAPTPVAPTPVAPVAPTPVAPTPVAPTPVAPTPVAPTPVAPTPVAPTPVAPTPVAPTPVAPQVLTTPSLSVSMGPGPSGTVYANVTVTNYDSSNSYSSNAGSQNPEYPEEWNIEGLTSGQSYTVNITASRSGYTSATGSTTFTASSGVAPTPVAPTPSFAIDSISSTTTTITYSWSNAPAGTAFYDVYYADNDAIYPTTTTGSTSKTFSGLNPNTPHTVFVVAKNSSNSTLGSANASINTQAVAPTPVAPTPVAPTPVAPTPVAPTPVAPTPSFAIDSISSTTNSITYSWSNAPAGTAFYDVYYSDNDTVYSTTTTGSTSKTFSGLVANTPHTVFVRAKNSSNATLASDSASISTQAAAPTPVAPTPVAPTPVAPTPVAPVTQYCYCAAYGYAIDCNQYCPSTPTPVAPTPVAPTPVAPTPVAPTPVAPTPVAPTPVAPPACVPGDDCGTTTNESTCKTTIRQYNSSCNCVVIGIYNFC